MAVHTAHPALRSRGFEDQWAELTDVPLVVTGALPAAVTGTLHRIVPTAFNWPKGSFQHWFDGHGQVHAVAIADGRARYTNRFVETPALARSKKTGRPGSNFGTKDSGLFGAFGPPMGTANTNVVKLGDRLLALQEGSKPQAMDPVTLETLGPTDLGFLAGGEGLSAHPHWDPRRREVVAANLVFGKDPIARVHTLDAGGAHRGAFEIALPYTPVLIHDFGLSAEHVLVPVFPHTCQILKVLAGLTSLNGASRWEPEKGAFVYVARRDGSGLRRYELPPMYSFHVVNSFEEADTLVMDMVGYDTGEIVDQIGRVRLASAPAVQPGRVERVRLYADGRSEVTTLHGGVSFEFPRLDPRRQGVANRFSFYVASRLDGARATEDAFAAVARLDAETGDLIRWFAPEGHQVGEAVPVAKPDGRGDAAVWLLSVVYDPAIHRSRVVVLDGEALEAGPVAEIHLPQHVPLGFHGNWSRG
jgi:carotenoid cleavage dioxygenase-like enzyme